MPMNLPPELKPPEIRKMQSSVALEEGSYLRTKDLKFKECEKYRVKEDYYFCSVGWHYLNSIHIIESDVIPKQPYPESEKPVLSLSSKAEAVGLGGALFFTETPIYQVSIDPIWYADLSEGFGFYSLFSSFKRNFAFSLDTLCQKDLDSQACLFGVGEAAFFVGYPEEKASFNAFARAGYQFASAYAGKKVIDESEKVGQIVAVLLKRKSYPKIKSCLEKSHPSHCL
ncbi:MAG: hypothetical protein KDD33_09210 [Bdellovibrionales bacterium]|nr:hypothetical protein [Bdellovibrionales bacterium]